MSYPMISGDVGPCPNCVNRTHGPESGYSTCQRCQGSGIVPYHDGIAEYVGWKRPIDDDFKLDYWVVAAALCRAFNGDSEAEGFWDVVLQLTAVYPQFAWDNVMTDQWPLGAPE
jgi:hypothetical protein